ncbi:hypothetical protein [Nonomuraea sp. NPDC050783]|uniref:hypothetical protein n=1 Tax=Nonomuraea sp. NPDC050783 TaxID=3154634 RepID=UPI0034663D26
MTGEGAEALAELLDERRHLLGVALWLSGSAATATGTTAPGTAAPGTTAPGTTATAAVLAHGGARAADGVVARVVPAAGGLPAAAGGTAWGTAGGAGLRQVAPERHDRAVRGFAAACDAGDPAAMRALLAGDAVAVSDGGGKLRAPIHPARGADAVARYVTALLAGRPGDEPALTRVNGRTGLVLRHSGRAVAVVGLSVAATGITAVWIILNPDKLRHWHLSPPRPAPGTPRART